jgi:adenylylsulfate kinase
MTASPGNIHPIADRLLQRSDKENLLGQKGICIWMTGLSGSGKSTIAIALERRLHDEGRFCVVLDGDNVRTGINSDLGFSDEDRTENIRRVAEIARLFVQNGAIVVCTFVSPTKAIREQARAIIGAADFVEVFIDAPLDLCVERDVKGLYAKAQKGEVKDFTGISAPFEAPARPDVHIRTAGQNEEESTDQLYRSIAKSIVRA